MNVISLFDSNVRKYPSKPFLRHRGQSYSYAQMHDLSRRAAAVFAQQGVKAGDRMALMCFNTPGFITAMLGAWRLNAVVVPVNHKMQPPEVDNILAHSKSKICVFDGMLQPIIARLAVQVIALSTDTAPAGHDSFDAQVEKAQGADGTPPNENDGAQILYTSGTTGKPKGCLLSHRNVCQAAMGTAIALTMTREERTLVAMPLWHSSPLNNWMMGTLLVGGHRGSAARVPLTALPADGAGREGDAVFRGSGFLSHAVASGAQLR